MELNRCLIHPYAFRFEALFIFRANISEADITVNYNILNAGPVLVCAGPNWEQFRLAQVPSQLAPRSVELGAGPNWEQLVQLA